MKWRLIEAICVIRITDFKYEVRFEVSFEAVVTQEATKKIFTSNVPIIDMYVIGVTDFKSEDRFNICPEAVRSTKGRIALQIG